MHRLDQDRVVWTYIPEEWPEGLVTAQVDHGGVIVEHVVSFRGRLRAMCKAALEEAWARKYDHIRFVLPHAFELSARLRTLAVRLGFERYFSDDFGEYYVAYR